MNTESTQRALTVFREACECSDQERSTFLDAACGDDVAVRELVETMLRYDTDDADEPDGRHPMRAVLADLADQAETHVAPPAPLPASIGGYRVTRFIARGGMGDVYEARQEHPERRVAIKVARTAGMTGEAARRFALEAQLLARLQHPGIAQIIEAGTTSADSGSQPFFAMEFVEGQSLTDYAEAHLPDARARLELMVAICETIGFAHRHGVIHRDLKPENVLIDGGGAPKVLDFGVAKVESAAGFGTATLGTEAGRVVGTLGYMAPEQLAGATEGIGPEADVYSLGVMIYELLSGRLPHELDAATLTRALAVVTTTDAPLLGVIRPEHRGDIEAVVQKALEKDRRHRYPDATALQQDLGRFLRGEPTLARPAGPLRKFAKWTRRNPALASAMFGLFLLLASTAAILMVKNHEVQTILDDYGRLEDARRLEEARLAADALWPTHEPGMADRLEKWLEEYRPLTAGTADRRAAVERLEAEAKDFATEQARWQYDQLVELVENLEEFQGADGLLASVERRHELARAFQRASRSDDWDAVRTRIRAEDSKYTDLNLEDHVGLIPLGQNPDTGLEEFLHIETHRGALPPPGNGKRFPMPMGQDTGLIFVLLPGGTSWMGAAKTDAESVGDMPNSDPNAIEGIEKSRRDDLEPFFMSKYEMTEGQWQYFVYGNRHCIPDIPSHPPIEFPAPNKPMNMVSFNECVAVLDRLGLMVPFEPQWEYAARAGTKQAYWTGPDAASLEGFENILEQVAVANASRGFAAKERTVPAEFYDGRKRERLEKGDFAAAPVGSYKANAFGLFDVAGNVSEYCYPRAFPREKQHPWFCMLRGGNHRRGVESARSAYRKDAPRGFGGPAIGVRPAMAIQR